MKVLKKSFNIYRQVFIFLLIITLTSCSNGPEPIKIMGKMNVNSVEC